MRKNADEIMEILERSLLETKLGCGYIQKQFGTDNHLASQAIGALDALRELRNKIVEGE